jgi:hypothetical protein
VLPLGGRVVVDVEVVVVELVVVVGTVLVVDVVVVVDEVVLVVDVVVVVDEVVLVVDVAVVVVMGRVLVVVDVVVVVEEVVLVVVDGTMPLSVNTLIWAISTTASSLAAAASAARTDKLCGPSTTVALFQKPEKPTLAGAAIPKPARYCCTSNRVMRLVS